MRMKQVDDLSSDGLFGFDGISIIVDYLMSNPLYQI